MKSVFTYCAFQNSYTRWWTAQRPYEVKYEEPYEPYVVADRRQLPRFDERFRYGWCNIVRQRVEKLLILNLMIQLYKVQS